jgi:hypothetical protein
MFVSGPGKARPSLSAKWRISPGGWIRVATIVVGIVIVVESAGTHGLGNLRAQTPMDVGLLQSDLSSTGGFGNGGFFGYDIGNGFKTGIEELGFHKDANRSSGLRIDLPQSRS